MKKIITWKTSNNQNAEVKLTLNTKENINVDGDQITVKCCDFDIDAYVDNSHIGYGKPEKLNHPVFAAKIGCLAMKQEILDKIEAAIAEIESTEEWQEKLKTEKESAKIDQEYETHRRSMKKQMGY
ncbi:MAG: hypothetical protein GY841_15530 [FCB group bacterium]|nr:hypothetical protein [FCB group bacterium]